MGLEICTGRNSVILPSLAGGPFGPAVPEGNLKYVTHTQPKPDFLLVQPELSPVCIQSTLTIVSLTLVSLNV
jgi:hypothetical protein